MPKSVLLSSLMPSSVMRISTDIRVGKTLGIQVHPRIGRRFGGLPPSSRRAPVGKPLVPWTMCWTGLMPPSAAHRSLMCRPLNSRRH